ncbi:MAG: hypothetical protein KBG80_09340 [Breznakibacter sp.]|nr:hypothetical protein [Breznakibacter sp.]
MIISEHEEQWLKTEGAKMVADLGVKLSNKVIDCGRGRYSIPISQVFG